MRRGQDIAVRFPGLYLVHQNIPGKTMEWHAWPQHVLFLPLQGTITILFPSGSLVAGPGKMIYVPPKTSMAFQSNEALGERLICMINHPRWRAVTHSKFNPTLCPAHQLGKEILFYLLLNPKAACAKSLVSTFIQVLSESLKSAQQASLLEVTHLDSMVRDERVRTALAILQRDHSRRVRMTAVAQEAGLGLRSLNRLFLEKVGHTPKQVLTHYRIAAARDLLFSGNTVTETAFATGYESLAQFITVFRRLTGQLPSQFARLGQKQ
ncbi:MAG: AraC family transcriptional regulator [Nitrospira sp.]|nr:AraC family transcriptional regulator [Nitrospira sp.]MDH4357706.1 AraC family transcriptional regulator [Nitrospira sp.]